MNENEGRERAIALQVFPNTMQLRDKLMEECRSLEEGILTRLQRAQDDPAWAARSDRELFYKFKYNITGLAHLEAHIHLQEEQDESSEDEVVGGSAGGLS